MSGGSDIWGSVDAGTYSDLEDDDDDEDDELGPRISATIKYVELPAKYDAPRVKLVKLNEATCPGCITACRRSIALSTVSIIFLVVASFDAVLSVAVVRVRMLACSLDDVIRFCNHHVLPRGAFSFTFLVPGSASLVVLACVRRAFYWWTLTQRTIVHHSSSGGVFSRMRVPLPLPRQVVRCLSTPMISCSSTAYLPFSSPVDSSC